MSFWRDKLDPPEVRKMIVEDDLKNLAKEKVEGLDEIIHGFIPLRETGIYEDLKKAYPVKKIVDPTFEEIIAYNMPEDSVFKLANSNLSHSILKLPFTDLVSFTDIYHTYRFLGLLYYTKSQNPSDLEDFLQMYNSGIDRNLILFQNKFDEKNSNNTELSPEFFQNLKKIQWKDNKVKKFFYKIEHLRRSLIYPTYEYAFKFGDLSTIEHFFIQLIADCSAVSNKRNLINKNDVIISYKTYFKLLGMDVTKYKSINTTANKGDGYLICNQCREYYKLQPGESPEDFTDKCECGGRLQYYDNIEQAFK